MVRLGSHRLAAAATAIVVGVLAVAAPANGARDTKGTDFWLGFPGNNGPSELSLRITGDTATSGNVAVTGGLSFSENFTVTPGSVTTVALPAGVALQSSDVIAGLGVHVTAADEVSVVGWNWQDGSNDGYLGFPTDTLGREYFVLGWKNGTGGVSGSQFAIVGMQDDTDVTITPTVTTNGHNAGVPYLKTLDRGSAYLLRQTTDNVDLSGTLITASAPVAVFAGHVCGNVPSTAVSFCDHLVEQLPPTSAWGRRVAVVPLAGRAGDTLRVMGLRDGTTLTHSFSGLPTSLNRGQMAEVAISSAGEIVASEPILVMQYSNGNSFDSSDPNMPPVREPFQMLVPPEEQYLASYNVMPPEAGVSDNTLNLMVPAGAVGSVTLDGAPVGSGAFTPIGSSGFSGAQLTVGDGAHTVAASAPFGVDAYGYDPSDSFDSYGQLGGQLLAPVADVAALSLSPDSAAPIVGSQHCAIASLASASAASVPDVRVDFTVTGAHPSAGSRLAEANGQANYCYTGASLGDDTIVAKVGALSDTVTARWSPAPPAPPPPPPAPGAAPPPPAPPPAASTRRCVVPKLKGLTLRKAKARLKRARCRLGKVTRRRSPRKVGKVLSQRPKAGTRRPLNSKVAVVVGKR